MDPQNPFLTAQSHVAEHGDSQEVLAEQAIANAGQSQAMYNYNQKLLEQKERELMESIALNYGRIREVERELGNLQLQLKLTSGPKKHALELLRKKIEAQNERVAYVRSKHTAAKAAYERLDAELKQEEAVKDQLCGELNILVQQAAQAQLDKLEELKATLEGLYSGILPGQAAVKQRSPQAQPQQQQQHHQQMPPTSAAGNQEKEAGPSGTAATQHVSSAAAAGVNGSAADEEQERVRLRQEQEREEQERREAEERRRCEAEAAVARSRHVSLGNASGGPENGLMGGGRPNGAPAAASAATAAGATGQKASSGSPGRTAARTGSKAGLATAAPGAAPAARPKTPNGGATAAVQPKQRFAGFDT